MKHFIVCILECASEMPTTKLLLYQPHHIAELGHYIGDWIPNVYMQL